MQTSWEQRSRDRRPLPNPTSSPTRPSIILFLSGWSIGVASSFQGILRRAKESRSSEGPQAHRSHSRGSQEPRPSGRHRQVCRCWGLSCLNGRRKYRAVRVTARSLAGEVQGLEPTVGRWGPSVATESSVVPSVFTTDDRMTLVSSWTTICRGISGSRRGTKGMQPSPGARKPRSP